MSFYVVCIDSYFHDGSVTILKDGNIELFVPIERITRVKHDAKNYNIAVLHLIRKYTDKIDLLILNTLGDAKQFYLEHFKKLFTIIDIAEETKEHHLLHAYSGLYLSGFKDALCMVVDGEGAFIAHPDDDNYKVTETTTLFNAASIYEIQTVYKRVMCFENIPDNIKENIKHYVNYELDIFKEWDIGKLYHTVTCDIGFKKLEEGKTMGLSSYGRVNNTFNIPFEISMSNNLSFQDKADAAYKVQKRLEQMFLEKVKKGLEHYKGNNLVISGGCGLNILGNSIIQKSFPHLNIFVDPIANDASLSLGCAIYYYIKHAKFKVKTKPQDSVYLGPDYSLEKIERSLRKAVAL